MLLEDYRGIVQCDGYAAYKNVANAICGKAITLAFCWAHLRRKFFEIAKDSNAPIASEALERIARLYVIEKTIRGQSADERRAGRQERSKPLVIELKAWFEQQLARVSGKSLVADAIRYALNRWDGPVCICGPNILEAASARAFWNSAWALEASALAFCASALARSASALAACA